MELTKHTQIINKLRQNVTDVEIIQLLDELHNDYQTEIPRLQSEVNAGKEELTTVTGQRDQYAKINAKYWEQLNSQALNESGTSGQGGNDDTNNEPPAKLNFDDLVGDMIGGK